jgi:hypothetical protein
MRAQHTPAPEIVAELSRACAAITDAYVRLLEDRFPAKSKGLAEKAAVVVDARAAIAQATGFSA